MHVWPRQLGRLDDEHDDSLVRLLLAGHMQAAEGSIYRIAEQPHGAGLSLGLSSIQYPVASPERNK